MTIYCWEIQRYNDDLQAWRMTDADPAGETESRLHPSDFAYTVLADHGLLADPNRRCVVWDSANVCRPPTATFAGCPT